MTVQAAKNFKGIISRGTWIEMSLYGRGLGVIISMENSAYESVNQLDSVGGGYVNVAFLSGHMMKGIPETLLRQGTQYGVIEGKALASENTIRDLLYGIDQREQEIKSEEETKKIAFDKAREMITNDTCYEHLSHVEKYSGGSVVAKNIRKDLKKHFLGHKFSVKSDYYHVNVEWTDGPTVEAVDAIVGKYKALTQYSPFNEVFGGVDRVSTVRQFSDAAIQKTIDTLTTIYSSNQTNLITVDNFRKGALHSVFFEECQFDDVSKLLHCELSIIPFFQKTTKAQYNSPDTHAAVLIDSISMNSFEAIIHDRHAKYLVSFSEDIAVSSTVALLKHAQCLRGSYSDQKEGFVFNLKKDAQRFQLTYS
ncbi:hypothetical protein GNP82_08780 [Aliivibrio fischeri]|uniref:LPD29 domain-containing protein n=1 Tax=Aliivibrio fischeri TaxID=668 RepID=UPI0012D8C38D|nr:LPD29 domain-containing protein [Aliivibrio fischeri]MUK37645.1 hypothetical protein [Aliivibrio fischeri]